MSTVFIPTSSVFSANVMRLLCGPLRISAFSAINVSAQRTPRYAEGRREDAFPNLAHCVSPQIDE
jgi:hypothetical protein